MNEKRDWALLVTLFLVATAISAAVAWAARRRSKPPTREEMLEARIAVIDRASVDADLEGIRLQHERSGLVERLDYLRSIVSEEVQALAVTACRDDPMPGGPLPNEFRVGP